MERAKALPPVFEKDSVLLILGSFPSVQSRRTAFYYGNPQNRFWKTLAGYFGVPTPRTNEEKRAFVLSRRIALWDTVAECEIDGSKDGSIQNVLPADLRRIFGACKIQKIFLNGKKALGVFEAHYGDCGIPYAVLPSTSPANPRFDEKQWKEALDGVFGADRGTV